MAAPLLREAPTPRPAEREALRVVHAIAPAAWGGAERVVQDLTGGLAGTDGLSVEVIGTVSHGERPACLERLAEAGVAVHRVEVGARGFREERRAVARLLDATRPHVVHTHGYRPDVLVAGMARRRGAATVSTVHGFTGGGARMWAYERLQALALRRMDRVVAVSGPLADELVRRGVDRERVEVVRNAWSPDPDPLGRGEARRALGVDDDRPLVGWVGRFSREKGPDLLAPVTRLLDAPATVVALGDGPEHGATREAAADPAVGGRLLLPGAVPSAARLMAAFDVLLLTSRTEGTPIVVLEAMHAGVPVVAPRVGGLPEMLAADAGLLVRPGSADALARGVRSLLSEPALARRLAASAGRRLATRYARGPWIERHRDLYASLLPREP